MPSRNRKLERVARRYGPAISLNPGADLRGLISQEEAFAIVFGYKLLPDTADEFNEDEARMNVEGLCATYWKIDAESVFDRERVPPSESRALEICRAFWLGQDEKIEWRLFLAANLLRRYYQFVVGMERGLRYSALLAAICATYASRELDRFLKWEKSNPGAVATAVRVKKRQTRVDALAAAIKSEAVVPTVTAVISWRGQAHLTGKQRAAARRQAQRDLTAARTAK